MEDARLSQLVVLPVGSRMAHLKASSQEARGNAINKMAETTREGHR